MGSGASDKKMGPADLFVRNVFHMFVVILCIEQYIHVVQIAVSI